MGTVTRVSSHHTDTQYMMLHLSIIIVLFLNGLETSPVSQVSPPPLAWAYISNPYQTISYNLDGFNQSGEPETLGSALNYSLDEAPTSTLATIHTESDITVPDANLTEPYMSSPAKSS